MSVLKCIADNDLSGFKRSCSGGEHLLRKEIPEKLLVYQKQATGMCITKRSQRAMETKENDDIEFVWDERERRHNYRPRMRLYLLL